MCVPEFCSWERVTLEPAIRVLESLEASALKVLDVGLMTQLTKYVDGPLLPGPGIQVMAANAAAWRLQQVRPLGHMSCLMHLTMARFVCDVPSRSTRLVHMILF